MATSIPGCRVGLRPCRLVGRNPEEGKEGLPESVNGRQAVNRHQFWRYLRDQRKGQ